ncbi:bifunctional phosphopantothenoylcysteine decarboxylase/phosphopantothenate--cysteine ligase CoaBC [Maricurvus nonylphenolicus]|uniref:bifunctional phosphopantothenoylcysteine decarboxylase/phosphopantothenate--cysteine ligase CoaBC n=1 Tax=Maricurvus nonylphenolicus TaxID=1008307 RepID=UPI0036F38339
MSSPQPLTSLNNKRILLGISGGIAAYKSAELIRRLMDHGADVRVVMTRAAQEFITPLTLQALSGNPVHTELLDPEAEAGMGHIELARWADLVLIAPASADLMARLAQGKADDLLTTLFLATPAQVVLAPAMNQGMWRNASTQANAKLLEERSVTLLGPAEGSQACGDVGPGRMLEPDELAALTAQQFQSGLLAGKKVVITAGPTREAIDPVRYISNHSSGKMGYALAEAAAEAGATTILISGPTQLATPDRVQRLDVTSAQEMYDATMASLEGCDLFIASAAVADYRPAQLAEQKIKKTGQDTMTIELVKNPDIVTAVAASQPKPYTVGFAAETQDVVSYARGKLERKKLDLVIANDVSQAGIGFNSDRNAVTLVWPTDEETLAENSKTQLARDLIARISAKIT